MLLMLNKIKIKEKKETTTWEVQAPQLQGSSPPLNTSRKRAHETVNIQHRQEQINTLIFLIIFKKKLQVAL